MPYLTKSDSATLMIFSRIDLYNVDGKIYFGEITFFPDSGFDSNLLRKTDELLGEYIELK